MSAPDYSTELVEQDPNAIKRLNALVAQMAQLAVKEAELEEQLESVQQELKTYQENLVPELMAELGMTDLTTQAGIRVEMREDVRASFPKDPTKREAAFAWLKTTGNDGLVKREFRIKYGRDSQEWADRFTKVLADLNISEHATVEQDLTIHHQTLLAFLRKELAAGVAVPLESFGAFVQRCAKVKGL